MCTHVMQVHIWESYHVSFIRNIPFTFLNPLKTPPTVHHLLVTQDHVDAQTHMPGYVDVQIHIGTQVLVDAPIVVSL